MQLTEDLNEKYNSIEEFRKKADASVAKISFSDKAYAPIAALKFLRLLRDHTQAILLLAYQEFNCQELFLLPSALALCRTVLETFGRLIWLIKENDPDKREIRFISMLENEKHENNKYRNEDRSRFDHDNNIFETHITQAQKNLSEGASVRRERVPKAQALLTEIGEDSLSELYSLLNKSVHGNHQATWIYTENDKALDLIKEEGWYCPLFICHYTYIFAIDEFLNKFGDDNAVVTEEIKKEIKDCQNRLSVCKSFI